MTGSKIAGHLANYSCAVDSGDLREDAATA
jgi:hypothetical protein